MALNLDCAMRCGWLLLFGFDCCLLWFVMLSRGFDLFVEGGWRFVGLVCLGFGFVVWFVIWFGFGFEVGCLLIVLVYYSLCCLC